MSSATSINQQPFPAYMNRIVHILDNSAVNFVKNTWILLNEKWYFITCVVSVENGLPFIILHLLFFTYYSGSFYLRKHFWLKRLAHLPNGQNVLWDYRFGLGHGQNVLWRIDLTGQIVLWESITQVILITIPGVGICNQWYDSFKDE